MHTLIHQILEADASLLLLINGAHSALLDDIMWYISYKWTWIPLYILLIGYLVVHYKKQYVAIHPLQWPTQKHVATQEPASRENRAYQIPAIIAVLLLIAVGVGLSDYISSGILKHLIARPRPTHNEVLSSMLHIVRDYRGGKYGFPSSHAANTFFLATFLSMLCQSKKIALPLFTWAVLNCYSRMYLGVHYPLDILVGALLGAIIAWALVVLYNRLSNRA